MPHAADVGCICGHVLDEHSRTGECQVLDVTAPDGNCPCGAFEPTDEED